MSPEPGHSRGADRPNRPLSALPSVRARAVAFATILVAGLCGGFIGYGIVGLQCHGACTTPDGIGALIGAALAAGGVAVVAVLTLRAMGEWRTIKEERALAAAAETAGMGETGGTVATPAGEQQQPDSTDT